MAHVLPAAALAVLAFMTLVFLLAIIRKDNSIVDIAWGLGFIIVALLSFFWHRGAAGRHILATALVLVWGLRLTVHIYLRKRGRGEDFRYAQWRTTWGRWFVVRSYFQIFVLQSIFLLLIAYPVVLENLAPDTPWTVWDVAGLIVWIIGFLFEAVGDSQMEAFKRNPSNKGRIMTRGLWRYTRHPNYFGEAAMWWGIFLIALSNPRGWLGLFSPLFITFLLLKVSGVPMLERKYAGNAEFAAYAWRTSVFFPWFPKKSDMSAAVPTESR